MLDVGHYLAELDRSKHTEVLHGEVQEQKVLVDVESLQPKTISHILVQEKRKGSDVPAAAPSNH